MLMDPREPKLTELYLKNFRGVRHLEIDHLGHVNLFVGKNSDGKSTILEAIRILAAEDPARDVVEMLMSRGEVSRDLSGLKSTDEGVRVAFESLFFDRPSVRPFSRHSLFVSGGLNLPSLKIELDWAKEEYDPEQDAVQLKLLESDSPEDPDQYRAVVRIIRDERLFRSIRLESRDVNSLVRRMRLYSHQREKMPNVYSVGPTGLSNANLFQIWDTIALTELEHRVVAALRLISPEIEKVALVGNGEARSSARQFIVKTRGFTSPVPMASLGDGIQRMLGVVLAIVGAADGVALIDEIENGVHYSVMEKLWSVLFASAKELNVQVFVATHSLDCIRAFQKVSRSDEEMDGQLIRVERQRGEMKFVRFSEEELEIASDRDIEVR
jgi:hypothetical protein